MFLRVQTALSNNKYVPWNALSVPLPHLCYKTKW